VDLKIFSNDYKQYCEQKQNQPLAIIDCEIKEYKFKASYSGPEIMAEIVSKILTILSGFNSDLKLIGDFMSSFDVVPSSVIVELGYGMKVHL
jgi:hypothetical protein